MIKGLEFRVEVEGFKDVRFVVRILKFGIWV
jgi:hypothetical protein